MRRFILFILLLLTQLTAFSQLESSNLRVKRIGINQIPTAIDSLSIIPGSVFIYDLDEKPINHYILSNDSILLRPQISPITTTADSLIIVYRVFPINFKTKISKLDSTKLLPKPGDVAIRTDYDIYKKNTSESIFSQGLTYDGSFARGLSFGNNQSLVLNSNFNLQLGGTLGDDIEVLAAISDANIPIQAEGTTQQLQDFDKVFIQLKKDQTSLIAGDYELSRPNSYFINYYKKLQGLSVTQDYTDSKTGTFNHRGSVAITRGKFARNFLSVTEGNQGPYKLTGSEGERFLIVLSGTEKVFLDGRLLTRGEENDYVIYYDRAEIVFSTNTLITKDSRIIIEFEYAVQRYLRSFYQYESAWTKQNWNIDFSMVSEQDSKSTSGSLELDSLDLTLLANSGDVDEQAIRSGIVRNNEPYSNSKIYYKKELNEALNDSILVYTSDPDSAFFQASFSDVGQGSGSYSIDERINANGRVYKYVGEGKGRYEPYIRLVAPELRQMYALKSSYAFNQNGNISFELGVSHFDLNRFSEVGDNDNLGLSSLLKINQKFNLGEKNKWEIYPSLSLETKGVNFQSFNPYRNPEFIRDWNINPETSTNELLGNASIAMNNSDKSTNISYALNNFSQFGVYNGYKHQYLTSYDKNGFNFSLQGSYLITDSPDYQSTFSRPKVEINKQFKKLDNWRVGWYGEREKNEIRDNGIEDLNRASFWYDYTKWYIRSDQKDNFNLGFSYNQRKDYAAFSGSFENSTTAHEYEVNGKWNVKTISTSGWSFIYRKLDINNSTLTNETPNAVLLGNFNHILRLWKGALNSTLNYKVSSGQEPKIEFDFREVLPGEGDYVWIDDGDGIIERNEFEVAPFRDQANYIRVNLFNNEFIKTNNTALTQSIRFEPKSIFNDTKSVSKKVLSKFSLVSNFRLENKNTSSSSLFSLDQFSATDTALVSFNSLYNGILYYNRGGTAYDIQLGMRNNQSKIVQTLGFIQRGLRETYIRGRIGINRNTDFISVATTGIKSQVPEMFTNNDFHIQFFKFEPQLSYRIGNQLRINTNYLYNIKTNNPETSGEKAVIHDFKIGAAYSKIQSSRINTELKFVQINYTGQANSVLELNMLDGLKNGSNILWAIDYSKRIMKNVDISISYEGRKTGNNRVIHVGRAQVKSIF